MSTGSTRTVYRGGRVVDGRAGSPATSLAAEDGRVVSVGDAQHAESYLGTGEGAPEVVELHGALLTPGFVDSHVHTVRTGFAITGLDLTGSPSLAAALDALAALAVQQPDAGVLVGQGWDETSWPESRPPTGAELERAAPGRRSYLTRVDGHSSVISPALAALVPGLDQLDGATVDGRVERDAHHVVRTALESLISDADRLEAARAACRSMATRGITGFHENAAPHIGPETEIELVRRAAGESGLRATVYWGELMALDTGRRLGVTGLAGDLVADGAFGSRTAALGTAYADRPATCGHAYLSADQIRDHVVACTEAGLQAGFHCIGDVALEAVGEGFAQAEAILGAQRLRAARHRLEHVEMPSPATITLLARLGVSASVQPMFDALWGGPHDMYAARLGERWRVTNPLGDLHAASVSLAFGSDSPVTAIGPWAAVRAAVHHRNPDQRLDVRTAFEAHTAGSARAGLDDEGGVLRPGRRADLALWRVPGGLNEDGLPVLGPDVELPGLLRTVAAGHPIHLEDA